MHVSTPDRRDRLWLINALAVVLLTLLGAAGEQLGYDRHLKTNTDRAHSFAVPSRSMLYELMPNMTDFLLLPLIRRRFAQMLAALSPLRTNVRLPSENEKVMSRSPRHQ